MASFLEIHAAADALVAKGIKPTQAAIRKALGGGSFTTISESMKSWPNRASEQAEAVPDSAPDFVASAASKFASATWDAARKIAEERLTIERAKLNAERIQMESEKKETNELVDSLDVALTTARAECDLFEQRKLLLETKNGVLAQEVQELRSKLALAVSNAAQSDAVLTEARGFIGVLTSDLNRERTALDIVRAEAKAASESAAVLRGKLDGVSQQGDI